MDDAVALVLAAPAIALCLWAVAFAGDTTNAHARTAYAAEAAAAAAAHTGGTDPADTAQRTALTATINACDTTTTTLDHSDPAAGTAAVTVTCHNSGPPGAPRTVCATGYAQTRPAASGHFRVACAP